MVMIPHGTPWDFALAPPADAAAPSHDDTTSFDILESSHSEALEKALKRVLSTEIAIFTYAQIIDGLPTDASLHEFQSPRPGHPVLTLDHHDICPGVLEKTRGFRDSFEMSSLRFSLPLLLAYQDTRPGTKPFHLRLIELLTVSCHQIAVYLFQLDDGVHKHSEYETWRASPPNETGPYALHRAPVAFCHNSYIAFEQYPNGVADCVGYWAEAKIFGGVVVFDRGESERECNDVFLHGSLLKDPRTIYAPTHEQFEDLISFLEDPDDSIASRKCPLPMNDTFLNRYRWDRWEAMAWFHVFRDRYERRIKPERHPRLRLVKSSKDWPEIMDQAMLADEVLSEADGKEVDHEEMAARRRRLKQITPSSPRWSDEMVYRGVRYSDG